MLATSRFARLRSRGAARPHARRAAALLSAAALALGAAPVSAQSEGAAAPPARPDQLRFYGTSPDSPIAGGVVIPAGRAFVWTSGTVPREANPAAERGSRERFGDTYTQAKSVLSRIAEQLAAQGLTLRDVVYLRAYLVPDAQSGGRIDMQGWSKAYGEVFGTENNPTKPARSTVGVAALVQPEWLIEIEAFAVFPG
jgi:enamine deaminase RidA (YjgF/YER057c/UK114 family)